MRWAPRTGYVRRKGFIIKGGAQEVMRTSTRITAGCALALAALLSLSACGSSSDPASRSARKVTKAQRTVPPGERPPSDMVAAVSASKSGPPVELKFELRGSPQPGQPLDVDIAVVADNPTIDRVYGKFSAQDGIDIVAGDELEAVDKPAPGAVIRHVVQILPRQEGIFTLSAAVGVESSKASVTRVYSIPIIVGAGLTETPAKSGAAGEPASPGTAQAH